VSLLKKILVVILIIWAVEFFCFSISFSANYIFVVDVSGSMRRNDLSERVKSTLNNYIEKLRPGDRVIVMTFGTDVNAGIEDRTIQGPRDIAEIQRQISRLGFHDRWTWMTKAFDVIFKRIEDLRRAYPDEPVYVYIFTDGNNEPPPEYRDMYTFRSLLQKYAPEGHLKIEKAFVYLIMFGIEPSAELQHFASQIKAEIHRLPPKPKREILKEIEFTPKELRLDLPYSQRKASGTLRVERLVGVKKVRLYLVPEKNAFRVFPRKITLLSGEEIAFTFDFSRIMEPGNYTFNLLVESETPGVIVKPRRIPVRVKIEPPSHLVLSPKTIDLSVRLSKELKRRIKVKVEELSGVKNLEVFLKPREEGVRIVPEKFIAQPGREEVFEVTFSGIHSTGEYSYSFVPMASIENVKIEPSQISIHLFVKKPFPWWILGVIAGLICFLVLIFLGIKIFCIRWPEEYYVVKKVPLGEELRESVRYELRDYQKFCRSGISSADMGISDAEFEIYLARDGRIYAKIGEVEKDLRPGDEIVDNYYFEIR